MAVGVWLLAGSRRADGAKSGAPIHLNRFTPASARVRLYYGFAMTIRTLLPASALALTLMVTVYGGSGGPAPPTPTRAQAPASVPQCAVTPAESNPPGGGGTPAQIQIDPGVYGTADMSKVTVFGFSQGGWNAGPPDPQIAELVPDIVPRAWNRWDLDGLREGGVLARRVGVSWQKLTSFCRETPTPSAKPLPHGRGSVTSPMQSAQRY